ncbi:MAG: TMEM143 family protein [Planctomycetaceae bacterium]|nr:TMEM143 family protein [Planctomycetaceae bacterium]
MNFTFTNFRPQIVTPEFLEEREHFLPIRIEVLLERMVQEERLDDMEREHFRVLRRLLADRFHYEYHRDLESLKNDFVPFDPDCETLCEPEYTDGQLREIRLRLYDSIREVLQIGNYREMTPEQFAECLELQPIGGLSVRVDTGDFDQFHVYYRGVRQREETERILFFWKRTRPVASLNRVFVIARFKPEYGGRVLVKMFKDIPVENIKIIAPKVKLGMPVFARVKIGGSVAGSLITPLSKLVFAFTMSWIYFCIILGGLLLAAFKGTMSFLNSRTKYMQVYSSNLYYRNLSNNTAALTTLLDAAETQELKETLLGYFILYLNRDRDMTEEELDTATERWIDEQFGHHFDFEVVDAIRKLVEKEIVHVTELSPGQFGYRVRSLPEALVQLDQAWDDFNTFPNVA